jgi:hypothetical protein
MSPNSSPAESSGKGIGGDIGNAIRKYIYAKPDVKTKCAQLLIHRLRRLLRRFIRQPKKAIHEITLNDTKGFVLFRVNSWISSLSELAVHFIPCNLWM